MHWDTTVWMRQRSNGFKRPESSLEAVISDVAWHSRPGRGLRKDCFARCLCESKMHSGHQAIVRFLIKSQHVCTTDTQHSGKGLVRQERYWWAERFTDSPEESQRGKLLSCITGKKQEGTTGSRMCSHMQRQAQGCLLASHLEEYCEIRRGCILGLILTPLKEF